MRTFGRPSTKTISEGADYPRSGNADRRERARSPHVRRPPALRGGDSWLETVGERESVLVCRVVQLGALRILTKPSIMREETLSAEELWNGWERVLADERFREEPEPAGLVTTWRAMTRRLPRNSCADTDAYLAAFAVAGGWTLCTFDKGFARYRQLQVQLLSHADP